MAAQITLKQFKAKLEEIMVGLVEMQSDIRIAKLLEIEEKMEQSEFRKVVGEFLPANQIKEFVAVKAALTSMEPTTSLGHDVIRLEELRLHEKSLKKEMDAIKDRIKAELAAEGVEMASGSEGGKNWNVAIKKMSRSGLDKKALQVHLGEDFAKFETKSSYSQLNVKVV